MRGVRAILVWLSEYMGHLSSSRWYLLDLLLTWAWWYISCSTFQDFLLTAQIMNGRIANFHVLTPFLHSFLLHLLRLKWCSSCCSDCIYCLQQLYSGSMTETYRVLLHLSCEIITDCLVFADCAQIYYFTVALFVSYLHHHSFSYFGSQYRCAKPSLYICFEFSEWCYYGTTFGFQNHILGLWHGDESWFWHWGHVINMTSSYAMWRWCQYTSEAGYLWTLCNVVDFRDSHHVWVFYALVLFGAFVSSTFYIICSRFRRSLMSCICIDRSWSNVFNDFGACHVHTKAGWLDAEAFYSSTRSIGIGKIVQHDTQGSDSLLSYSCKEHLYGLTSRVYWHAVSSFAFDICWWYA